MTQCNLLPDSFKSHLNCEILTIESNNSFVLIQDYFPFTLSQVNLTELFSVNTIYNTLIQISNLIKEIHQISLIHGNIKPSNILITIKNKYLLSDYFQNLLFIDIDENNLTDINDKRYLSPEIIKSKEYDTKTDIWSFGCLIYYILSGGSHLFSESIQLSLFYNITNCKHERLKIEKYSDQMNELLDKLICKDEEERLNIDEVIEEIKENEEIINDIIIKDKMTVKRSISRNKRSTSPTPFQNIPIMNKTKTIEKTKNEDSDISHIAMLIKGKLIMFEKVYVLDLNNCNIGDIGMKILYDLVIKTNNKNNKSKVDSNTESNNNNINKQILLQNNNISDKGFVLLLDMLEWCNGLKILNLSHNHITSQCFEKLEKSVRFMVDLEVLDLSFDEIMVSSLDILKKILKNMKHLRVLDISSIFWMLLYCVIDNKMTESDVENFAKKIQSISEFEHLEIK